MLVNCVVGSSTTEWIGHGCVYVEWIREGTTCEEALYDEGERENREIE